MEPTGPQFTCLTNESIALDRGAELCLQPAIFLSRVFFGETSVKVYRIDSMGKIHDLPSSNRTSIIHTFCMCILGAIVLIPGILVGGFLKGLSCCTQQHKKDYDKLKNFLHLATKSPSISEHTYSMIMITQSFFSTIFATAPGEAVFEKSDPPSIQPVVVQDVNQRQTASSSYLKQLPSAETMMNEPHHVSPSSSRQDSLPEEESLDPSSLAKGEENTFSSRDTGRKGEQSLQQSSNVCIKDPLPDEPNHQYKDSFSASPKADPFLPTDRDALSALHLKSVPGQIIAQHPKKISGGSAIIKCNLLKKTIKVVCVIAAVIFSGSLYANYQTNSRTSLEQQQKAQETADNELSQILNNVCKNGAENYFVTKNGKRIHMKDFKHDTLWNPHANSRESTPDWIECDGLVLWHPQDCDEIMETRDNGISSGGFLGNFDPIPGRLPETGISNLMKRRIDRHQKKFNHGVKDKNTIIFKSVVRCYDPKRPNV